MFINGTTGESVSLTVAERKAVLEAWMNVKQVKDGSFRVIVHIGANALEETVELAKHAQAHGAHGCAMMAPCYYKPKTEK